MQSKAPPRETDRHSRGTRLRRGLGFWIRRGLVGMAAGLLALAVIGAIYQAVATAVLLIVSIPVTMFLDPTAGTFQESIGQILLGIAVAALGWHALRMTPSSTPS